MYSMHSHDSILSFYLISYQFLATLSLGIIFRILYKLQWTEFYLLDSQLKSSYVSGLPSKSGGSKLCLIR